MIIRLFIPPLGTRLELDQAWEFYLYAEDRNSRLFDLLAKTPLLSSEVATETFDTSPRGEARYSLSWDMNKRCYKQEKTLVKLPIGTILVVDRIYIRSGQEDFDSVSFMCERIPGFAEPQGKKKTVARFWAKLDDINKIVAKVDPNIFSNINASVQDIDMGMTD